ncbi:MAG: 2-C-methyl-D-erythritol 4-phosphate cytidylyltransferase [Gammaproteobacteria bacterium]|nr:2-C-methyl-D-erythritol 4-phosphate cytidylyltransferase [Gammaproteobacteria bacterium]
MSLFPRYWAVVPAAGIGSRMQSECPKQYLNLLGTPVLVHTVATLLSHTAITQVIVAVSPEDEHWMDTALAEHPRVHFVTGGSTRAASVLAALSSLEERADEHDFVLVHDAARPCLTLHDVNKLMTEVRQHPVGGILGCPVRDTMKRTRGSDIEATVEREELWHALTPQMFRLGLLRNSLLDALGAEVGVTDEASAVEWAGFRPLMVTGRSDNLKITEPLDLPLAEFYLQQQLAQGLRLPLLVEEQD